MRILDKFKHLASDSRSLFGSAKSSRLVSFSTLFVAVCAFGAVGVAPLAPDAAYLPVKKITEDLDLPNLEDQISALEQKQHFIREEKVLRGDSLAALMLRLGVDDEEATRFIKTDATAKNVMHVKAGKSVRVQLNQDGTIEWLQASLQESNDKQPRTLTVSRDASGKLNADETNAKLERRVEMRSGNIRSSLFAATDEAQIPDSIANQIVSMFETNVDFRYLQRGDHFNIVYESFWQNGELVKNGRILAGEFSNVGKLFQSVWFEEAGGNGGYYSFDGKSLKKLSLSRRLNLPVFLLDFQCVCTRFPVSGNVIPGLILLQSPVPRFVRPAMVSSNQLVRTVGMVI